MKKRGFTLAEVLITLAIIGIVATMTLPALMNNSAEQQAKTGLKKAINTLTEAAATAQALTGLDYSSVTNYGNVTLDPFADANENTLYALLGERLAVDLTRTMNLTENNIATADAYDGQTIHLRDGSAIIMPENGGSFDGGTDLAPDGLPQGFVIVYDTNGAKAPNRLSNCNGNTANGAADTERTFTGDTAADMEETDLTACTRNQRVIRDQFMLRLRGTTVEPEGAAAVWAFNN